MSLAIRADHLSKRYRITAARGGYRTLREEIGRWAAGRWAVLRGGQSPEAAAPDDFWALDNVSFEIARGQAVGVIGRNGAGKSTLLKILSRITPPTKGRARVRGRVGSLLEVGTGFHPELSGRENIYLNGAILGMSRREIRARFDRIVAFAEIERFLDTPVKRYSSGMYVRLAFAVAAHLEPDILVIDEVLAVGDAAFQTKCLGRMGDVTRQGRTVLFVSHNMAAVNQLCSRAVWLERGAIERDGPAFDVVSAYLATGSSNLAERQWSYPGDAPGDDRVRLLAARWLQHGRPAEVIDINQPCQVELDFAVLRPVENLIAGVSAYNAQHICLFNCCDWRPNALAAGRYRKQLELPAQILAEGRIDLLVQLVFYEPDVQSVVLPAALAAEAVDSHHPLAVRGHYKGAWPGVLRLALPWSDAVPCPDAADQG